MTDLLFPVGLPIARISPRLMDATARFTSPLTGAVRTVSRLGDRWGIKLDFQNLYSQDRARLEQLIANLRGGANRVLVSPNDFAQRGSFPSAELFSNGTFASGTSGWGSSGGALAAVDRRLRATLNGATGSFSVEQSVGNLTAFTPFVARYALYDGKGSHLSAGLFSSFIEGTLSTIFSTAIAAPGLNTLALTVDGTTGSQYPLYHGGYPVGAVAGDYVDVAWASLSQCMLVDNGPNLLEYSDTFASPWSPSNASVTTGATGPDGAASAANLVDTTANSQHYFLQSITIPSAIGDYAFVVAIQAAAQSWAYTEIGETLGGTFASAYFNLSTGALGLTGVGSNWTNLRAFTCPLGAGWFACILIARKTNAATGLEFVVGSANGNNSPSYAGTGASAIKLYRATGAQSSVPMQQTQSSSTAVAALAQTGSALYVKGLPVNTAGLLLAGDWCQIGNLASGTMELKRATASLDSDAAGRGYLQFSPPIRTSPNDGDPVIVNMPMGRFIASSKQAGWSTDPGYVSSGSLDLIEAA